MSHKFCLLRLRRCVIWPFSEENSVFMTFETLTLMLFDNDDRTPEIILNVFQTCLFYGDQCHTLYLSFFYTGKIFGE